MADDIFKDLSLLDRSVSNTDAPISRNPPPRSGPPPSNSRPSRSSGEDQSRRNGTQGTQPSRGLPRPRPAGDKDPFGSPEATRRPRRNSESSVVDKEKQAEDDKRRRERRKEREARREKEGKTKDGKPIKKTRGLDVIDKLDVTGIYGQGLFHHDGPFDACNPHRNRNRPQHRAPMQAFPANSANNALGGAAPKSFDHDKFHGREAEGFADFASTRAEYQADPAISGIRKKEQASFNPTDRVEQIHGEETHGLGTSTFLDGAPASRTAMQRRESENEVPSTGNMGGLGRKKSLAMRIRGISQPRRPGDREQVTSPDGYGSRSPDPPRGMAQSAGGPPRAQPIGKERNPFFNDDYDAAYEKKGQSIKIQETSTGRTRAPSSPQPYNPGLTRSLTSDAQPAYNDAEDGKTGGGFLNRMRSLKGGRRARPDRTGM